MGKSKHLLFESSRPDFSSRTCSRVATNDDDEACFDCLLAIRGLVLSSSVEM